MNAAKRECLLSSETRRVFTKAGVASVGLAVALIGCSKGSNHPAPQSNTPAVPGSQAPKVTTDKGGLVIPAGTLPKIAAGSPTAELPDGRLIALTYFGGVPYMTVEGTFADASYSRILTEEGAASLSTEEKNERVQKEINAALKSVSFSTAIIGVRSIPEVGYFRFLMPYARFADLTSVKGLARTLLVNPVTFTKDDQHKVKQLSDALNAELKDADLIGDTRSYSGLQRIGIKEFEAAVARDIPGVKIDGSSVKVGVTDTGVTYNHPALADAQGNSRVVYMKEFTGEGTIFFSEKAKFEARTPTADELRKDASLKDVLFISAEYLPPSTQQQKPAADGFKTVKDLKVRVSDELRGILTTPGNAARLAVFSEAPFVSADGTEALDINSNGTTDDGLVAIHVPSESGKAGRIYFDIAGKGDLRKVKPVGDFNTTKETITAFQERFGFDLRASTLLDSEQKEQEVVQAGIVGYDSGNHGSHVSGIIAARKTIQNDSDDTYARGVVPNASLMVNRVCANNGGCGATEAFIDLALNGAEVINMSLGGLSNDNDGYDVQSAIIDRLVLEKNVVFVISAGNNGPGRQTVGSPGVARLSLAVGASATRDLIQRQYQWPGTIKPGVATGTDENDFMLFFSSRGPTAAGGFKPNLSAPGTELSSIGLNAFPGSRQGLDVYWGTSMAAPTATGVTALLLDAAKKWNLANPGAMQLPADSLTIRSVLIESAKPFDVARIDAKSGEKSKGKYTWIDQGEGLINIARAWELLKTQSKTAAPASVSARVSKNGQNKLEAVPLDYEVRVLAKLPNGTDYTGARPGVVSSGEDDLTKAQVTPKFGKGLWIDPASKEQLYSVQIARRLPAGFLKRDDAGELARQLNTTAETFALETTVYGSDQVWLKAGTLNQLDCAKARPRGELQIIGQGALDAPGTPGSGTGSSIGLDASNLNVCVDTAAIRALPPGDHGAIVKAYRVANGKRESIPAFEVPVFLTKPHKVLEGGERYEIHGVARSFDVERNYVVVPEGTTVVNVSLSVPALKADGSGCAGVELMALEASNTGIPAEISPRTKAIASNCVTKQQAKPVRTISYSRFNPKPGVWDLHVFGRYQFTSSPYTLTVEYAKVATTISKLQGLPEVLNGSFDLNVKEATFEAKPDADKSLFTLDALVQTVRPVIKQEENLAVPNADGKVARAYDASVASVTLSTYGAAGKDLDLAVFECDDEAATKCASAGKSGGATDVEAVTFKPQEGKFYKAVVTGYDVGGEGKISEFSFDEKLALAEIDEGTLEVKQGASAKEYVVTHSFDVAKSKLLADERFKSAKYAASGVIVIRTAGGSDLASIPVNVSAKDDVSLPVVTPMPAPAGERAASVGSR